MSDTQSIVESTAVEAIAHLPGDVLTRLPLKQRKLLRYLALDGDEMAACEAAGYDYHYFQKLKRNPSSPFHHAYSLLFTAPIEYARQDLMSLVPLRLAFANPNRGRATKSRSLSRWP